MSQVMIKDIYAGMPDAKYEIETNQADNFFASFVVPSGLPVESLLDGRKFLVTGYKGVGKTSVLYYLQNIVQSRDESACTSFLYFKTDFEEIRKSSLETVGKKLTAIVDVSGEIQHNKVEYLHLWRWVFFKKILDDCEEYSDNLFYHDDTWYKFVECVNRISFSSSDKKVISLSSLSIRVEASSTAGVSANIVASLEPISKNDQVFRTLVEIVDQCEKLFSKLARTDIPYYLFVDEMEAFYGNYDLFIRDLTLIRDMIFTMYMLNRHGKVRIIGALRSEIIYSMDRFIQTREINKLTDGFSIPIRWAYNNTTSNDHPIIKILMKRIEIVCDGQRSGFHDWFPENISGKETVNFILDNGWNKPRDIVRLLLAAQNDSVHCDDNQFSQAVFDSLRKEYSKNSLAEIRQELQSLYKSEEVEMVIRLLRGGEKIFFVEDIRKKAAKGSEARDFWDSKRNNILEDFYRVGFWGNVNRRESRLKWRWNHKGDTGVLTNDGWELVIHNALCSELSIMN